MTEVVVIAVDDMVAVRTPQLELVRTSFAALGSTAVLGIGAFFLLLAMGP